MVVFAKWPGAFGAIVPSRTYVHNWRSTAFFFRSGQFRPLIKMMNLKDFRRLAIGDSVLVRSGRVASGEQGAQYHLTRPDTSATVVGFRKIGRDLAVSVRLEDGSHGVFRYLDVSRAF